MARAAVPWLAGAAIVLAAATGIKKARDADREHMGYGELTERKARRAWGKGEEALQDAKDRTERGWFGLKVRLHYALIRFSIWQTSRTLNGVLITSRQVFLTCCALCVVVFVQRRASETADDAGNKLNETKDAAARKASRIRYASNKSAIYVSECSLFISCREACAI